MRYSSKLKKIINKFVRVMHEEVGEVQCAGGTDKATEVLHLLVSLILQRGPPIRLSYSALPLDLSLKAPLVNLYNSSLINFCFQKLHFLLNNLFIHEKLFPEICIGVGASQSQRVIGSLRSLMNIQCFCRLLKEIVKVLKPKCNE